MDFIKFIYKNSFMQMGFFLGVFGLIYSQKYYAEVPKYYDVSLVILLLFSAIAVVQELFFFLNKKLYVYKDLAKLLIVTKKIENSLELLGGEGKGMYEKALSVEEYLKDSTMKELLYIADVRNKAMHSKPQIEDINGVLKSSHAILKELKSLYSWRDLKLLVSPNFSITEKVFTLFALIIKTLLSLFFTLFVINFAYVNAGIGAALLASALGFYLSRFLFNRSVLSVGLFTFLLLSSLLYLYESMNFSSLSSFSTYLIEVIVEKANFKVDAA